MADAIELRMEQDYFDRAWEFRERKRRDIAAAPAAAAGPRAGAAQVRRGAERQLEQVADPDEPVAFGRFDLDDETYYIGKHVITDDERNVVVVNWKMPVAEPFYKATHAHPCGVVMKRQFQTERNRVLDFEETIYAELAARVAALTDTERLGIDDTVLRELDADRDGEMRDIVQTIHAAQYDLIRAPLDQLLVIQGGPGTGKTAVALHRVSWLLVNHREVLEAHRVLVIGPNPTFTRYIQRVLPGLGDTNVEHVDLRRLGPQRSHRRTEDGEVARLKGDPRMADLLRTALVQRVRLADRSSGFTVGGPSGVTLAHGEVAARLEKALSAPTYNLGRAQFRNWVTETSRERAKDEGLLTASGIDAAVERIWPSLTPQTFVRDLLGSRERLMSAAGHAFTAGEVSRLLRPAAERVTEEQWSDADVALLDEADALINGVSESYEHIAIDEAQDLTPMQLRSIRRRSTNGSFTVVGDLAQATGVWAWQAWDDVIAALRTSVPVAVRDLELGYRVPQQVYEFAVRLLPYAAPGVTAPRVVRQGPADPDLIEVPREDLPEQAVAVAQRFAAQGLFVGIIAPDTLRDAVAAALMRADVRYSDVERDALGSTINLAGPEQAKGLEFDAVVVVEPADIAASATHGLRLLYIALTRTTRYLAVTHSGAVLPLPEGLPASVPPVQHTAVAKIPEPAPPTGELPLSANSRITALVAGTIARSLADQVRASAPEALWSTIHGELGRELGLFTSEVAH